MKQLIIIVQSRILVLHIIHTFKNKRVIGADSLLGEEGQDPCSGEERELREEEGRMGESAPLSRVMGRARCAMWGSSNDEGWQARYTHVLGPSVGMESRQHGKRSFPSKK